MEMSRAEDAAKVDKKNAIAVSSAVGAKLASQPAAARAAATLATASLAAAAKAGQALRLDDVKLIAASAADAVAEACEGAWEELESVDWKAVGEAFLERVGEQLEAVAAAIRDAVDWSAVGGMVKGAALAVATQAADVAAQAADGASEVVASVVAGAKKAALAAEDAAEDALEGVSSLSDIYLYYVCCTTPARAKYYPSPTISIDRRSPPPHQPSPGMTSSNRSPRPSRAPRRPPRRRRRARRMP